MNRMSKTKKILALAVILMFVGFLWRFSVLNKEYPNPSVMVYQEGEQIQGGDIVITVTDSELVSMEQVLKMAPDIQNQVTDKTGEPLKNEQKKILLVTVKINNISDTQQTMSLVRFVAQSQAWANGMDFESYCKLNDVQEAAIILEAGEQREMVMPFYLYEIQFTGDRFYKMGDRDFQLVLSTYPVKNIVELKI